MNQKNIGLRRMTIDSDDEANEVMHQLVCEPEHQNRSAVGAPPSTHLDQISSDIHHAFKRPPKRKLGTNEIHLTAAHPTKAPKRQSDTATSSRLPARPEPACISDGRQPPTSPIRAPNPTCTVVMNLSCAPYPASAIFDFIFEWCKNVCICSPSFTRLDLQLSKAVVEFQSPELANWACDQARIRGDVIVRPYKEEEDGEVDKIPCVVIVSKLKNKKKKGRRSERKARRNPMPHSTPPDLPPSGSSMRTQRKRSMSSSTTTAPSRSISPVQALEGSDTPSHPYIAAPSTFGGPSSYSDLKGKSACRSDSVLDVSTSKNAQEDLLRPLAMQKVKSTSSAVVRRPDGLLSAHAALPAVSRAAPMAGPSTGPLKLSLCHEADCFITDVINSIANPQLIPVKPLPPTAILAPSPRSLKDSPPQKITLTVDMLLAELHRLMAELEKASTKSRKNAIWAMIQETYSTCSKNVQEELRKLDAAGIFLIDDSDDEDEESEIDDKLT